MAQGAKFNHKNKIHHKRINAITEGKTTVKIQ